MSERPGAGSPGDQRANQRAGWVDSHCHLGWPGTNGEAPEDPSATIARATAAGVVAMVCVGTDLASSERAVAIARSNPAVRATVGLHPHDASALEDEWDALVALAERDADVVVGIGEGGFDLFYEHSALDAQEAAFRAQIALAQRLDVALVVHSRDAWDDTFRVLTDAGTPPRAVFHCFTGGPDEARRALDLGAYLSFSGIISFKNADDVRAAAALVPARSRAGGDRRAVPRAGATPGTAQRAGMGRRRGDGPGRGDGPNGRGSGDADGRQRGSSLRAPGLTCGDRPSSVRSLPSRSGLATVLVSSPG